MIDLRNAVEVKRLQIRLAIGNFVDDMNGFLVKLVDNACNGQYEVRCVSSGSINRLEQLGANEEIDIFILIANNLNDDPVIHGRLPMSRVVDLVSFLKKSCKKPVIVLSGYPDSYIQESVSAAGADAFFWLPVDTKQLVDATRKALSGRHDLIADLG